jgi:low density lipoprotein-related protein 2
MFSKVPVKRYVTQVINYECINITRFLCFYPPGNVIWQKINGGIFSITAEEPPKSAPQICPCQNGGICVEEADGAELSCLCQPDFSGHVCDITSKRIRRMGIFSSMLIIPLTGLLLLLVAGAIFIFIRKRPL